MDQTARILRTVPGLTEAPAEVLGELAQHTTLRRYADGATIFVEGAPATGLWVLAQGRVLLTRRVPAAYMPSGPLARVMPKPRPPCVGRVSPGQLFGQIGASTWSRTVVTATAEGAVAALELPLWRFRELYGSTTELASTFLRRALVISLGRAVREREQRAGRLLVDLGLATLPGQEPPVAPPEVPERPSALRE